MTSYRLDVYDTSGNRQAVITDFTHLSYSKIVNNPGMIQFGLSGEHELLSDIQDKWQIEVWRKPDNGDWARETTGLFRWLEWKNSDRSSAKIIANGLMSMLDWRIIAWTAGYIDRSKFTSTPAETIANTLVKYNATSDATVANGREREGAISGLSVETNGAEGNTIDWFCAYDSLLATLQDLTKIGGGDFDLVKTSSTTYQWRWYTGQLGTDKTSDVTFSLKRGNMANPTYIENRTLEKSVAIVGGQGEGVDREIQIVPGSNYNVTDNNIEMFVGATDVETTSGLITRGNQKLYETQPIELFDFDVLQTPSSQYGTHYQLGDLVTAINPYTLDLYTMKIYSVSVGVKSNGEETINVEMTKQ